MVKPTLKRPRIVLDDSDDGLFPSSWDLPMSPPVSAKVKKNEVAVKKIDAYMQPERSSIWFEDGNVVLEAENVQFKVHKSILGKRSAVLRAILDAEQPAGQIIRLEDSSMDILHFLSIVYGEE